MHGQRTVALGHCDFYLCLGLEGVGQFWSGGVLRGSERDEREWELFSERLKTSMDRQAGMLAISYDMATIGSEYVVYNSSWINPPFRQSVLDSINLMTGLYSNCLDSHWIDLVWLHCYSVWSVLFLCLSAPLAFYVITVNCEEFWNCSLSLYLSVGLPISLWESVRLYVYECD